MVTYSVTAANNPSNTGTSPKRKTSGMLTTMIASAVVCHRAAARGKRK